jgi:hypothetical protein
MKIKSLNHKILLNNYKININIRTVCYSQHTKKESIVIFSLILGTPEIGNDAKLDDAYLKMKRLDKALEEAFEKEKQVKIETMSLMKKYVISHSD